ncbi:hypothetical protein [Baia soyae]|uniref:Uncharacterized protein n=1 Tax=Baia soyae TaxID=1544746 RepID=A0A4R2RLR6_9BACL|nr:hypothetical protein [Baia soyae]TCP63838.1 hypothetical protein EDD57_14611 [Baia soyae]
MPLSFHQTKEPTDLTTVHELVRLVKQEPDVFRTVARIFDRYKTDKEAYKEGFDEEIELMIGQPGFRIRLKTRKRLLKILKAIYRQPTFQQIRSAFLEAIIEQYGPIHPTISYKEIYREPLIYDDGEMIGGYECRMDVVFHEQDDVPMEMVECKANIESFLSATSVWNQMKQNRLKKMHYMINLHKYLRECYVEPVLGFAFYNENCQLLKENVHENWGFPFIRFYSRRILYQHICEKE